MLVGARACGDESIWREVVCEGYRGYIYRTESVFNVVLQKPVPVQIRQLILFYYLS